MNTIYATESLFESADETFAQLKEYVVGAVGQAELHHVEQELFRRVQQVGRALLETFITVSGSGYQADHPPLTEDGEPMRYKGTERSPYVSIFGEINILRATYAHPRGGRVYPLDAQLNLPQHQFSYLLLKWLQAGSAEQDFRTAVNRFNEIFDCSFFPELPQRQGLPIAAYVEPFYQQVEAPPAPTEGSHIGLGADGKGVRILQSERPQPSGEEVLAKPRLGKGEKPGIKKEAVVVTAFSFRRPEPPNRSSRAYSTNIPGKKRSRPPWTVSTVGSKGCPSPARRSTNTSLPPSLAKTPPLSICWTTFSDAIPPAKNHSSPCWMAIQLWRIP